MKNLFKALAGFQQEVPAIHQGTKGYGYTYSDLRPISNETLNSFNELLDYFEQYRDLGNILLIFFN